MALIIKGDMPSKGCLNCFDCQYFNLSETSYFNNRQSYHVGCELSKFLGMSVVVKNADELHNKPSDCPILCEIPDEYGRLIDADAEIAKLKAFMKCLNKETESGGRQYHECYCVLHYLTALVEATE